jgi:hypothetical protein
MVDCMKYVPSNSTSSMGKPMDSCLHCGRTEFSHLPVKPVSLIRAYELDWGGKRYFYGSADEALKAGFHV